jgi:hypothetical protein
MAPPAASTARGSCPSSALSLEVRGGQLQTPDGPAALLAGLPGNLRVRQEEAGTLVLGVASSTGLAALADFPLGQVISQGRAAAAAERRHCRCCHTLRAASLGIDAERYCSAAR